MRAWARVREREGGRHLAANRLRGWLLGLLAAAASAGAATFEGAARHDGAPLPHALFSLHSETAQAAAAAGEGVMDQIDSQFAPRVLAVTVGSRVAFPNRDNIRHHVYSFSPAKRFELPLYSGVPSAPVEFDLAGEVALGCNIHDWMIGFVHVLDTPFHGVTNADGRVRIAAPAGRYRLRVWHERLAEGGFEEREVELVDDAPLSSSVDLVLLPPPPPRGDERLRALQERFRQLKRDPP